MRQRAAPAFHLPMSSADARAIPDPAYVIGWIERRAYPPLRGYEVQDILWAISKRAWDDHFQRCHAEYETARELGIPWNRRPIDYLKIED